MFFLILGIVLMALKFMQVWPVAMWSWYVVLAPFALAVAWWTWADWSGYTRQKMMEREGRKRAARRARAKKALALYGKEAHGARRRNLGEGAAWATVAERERALKYEAENARRDTGRKP